MNKIFVLFIFSMVFLISCTDQIVSTCDDEIPEAGLNASLSSIQEYILTPNCAKSGCHIGSNAPEGLDLSQGQSYGNLVSISSQQSGLLLVDPGSSTNSWIVKKLNAEGTSLMPPGLALSTAEIDTIKKWIDLGAQND